MSCNNLQIGGNGSAKYDIMTTKGQHNAVDVAKGESGSAFTIPVDSSKKRLSCCDSRGKFLINQIDDDMQIFAPTNFSCPKNVFFDSTEMEHIGTDVTINSNNGTRFDHIVVDGHSNRVRTNPEFLNTSKLEISSTGALLQTHSLDSIEVSPPGISNRQSSHLVSIDDIVGPSIPSQVDFSVLDDLSLSFDSEGTEVEQATYDPLDCPGTRDSHGEHLATSYNRRFLGTVDYIWCFEGLKTVRVLALISKHAMQWMP
ncbi:hypothetical protein REPUB_Repub03eG0116500 [Reevesia pubescens]